MYLDAIPNWKRSHSVALINAGGARAMRAPGHPQNCVLTEFAVDDLAAKLGIDPLVIRRKNLPPNDDKVKAKDPVAWAARRNDVYNQQLDLAVQLSGWKERWHPPGEGKAGTIKHGIGMALHTWGGFAAGGTTPNECTVTHQQGRVGHGRDVHPGPRDRPADGNRHRRRRDPRPACRRTSW